jgi:hypothetical protein
MSDGKPGENQRENKARGAHRRSQREARDPELNHRKHAYRARRL